MGLDFVIISTLDDFAILISEILSGDFVESLLVSYVPDAIPGLC
jgi:hypothetical protein